MLRKITLSIVVAAMLALVIGSLTMTTSALAQDGTGSLTPFVGTGELPPQSEQLVAPDISTASPVEGVNSRSVIGADGRKQVTATKNYPNRAIAYLYVVWRDNTAGSCSGWFIGPRTVVTAGHCVYSGGHGGYAKKITIYPGRNGASTPYGFTTSHRLFATTQWRTSASTDYDYGAIQTNDALGNTVGWFGVQTQVSDVFPGNYAVRGYPGDKPTATMWTMSGLVTNANTYRLWYNMDTFGGQSGSPLFASYNGVCCSGFGVHTYGASLSPYSGNSATRITQTVYNNLLAWSNVKYP